MTINLDETTMADEMEDGNTYTIRFTATEVEDSPETQYDCKDLYFRQGDDSSRNLRLWKNSTPTEVYNRSYTAGTTYEFSGIRHTVNETAGGTFENLNSTQQMTVTEVSAPEPSPSSDATETSTADQETPSTTAEASNESDLDAHIADGLTNVPAASEQDGDESGHVVTSVVSDEPLSPLTVQKYRIVISDGSHPSDHGGERSLTYTARRLIGKHHPGPIGFDRPLVLAALDPIAEEHLDTGDGFHLEHQDEQTLDYQQPADRSLAKDIIEEGLKQTLRKQYIIQGGLRRVLSKEIVEEGEAFALRRRYALTVEVSPTGLVYLHVDFGHRYDPQLTLADLNSSRIHPGLRVNTNYGRRSGYIVAGIGSARVTEPSGDMGNQSVVEYHRKRQYVPSSTIDQIEAADRQVIMAYRQGKGSGNPVPFPPELLVVQATQSQINRFADDSFGRAARKQIRLSPNQCTNAVHEFLDSNATFSIGSETLTFHTEFFSGNSERYLKRLYEPEEDILTFADGQSGKHPKETFNKGIAKPPDRFNVALICPEQALDDCTEQWETVASMLGNAGAEPTLAATHTYDIYDNADDIGMDISVEIDTEAIDTAFAVLPPQESILGETTPGTEVYDTLKESFTAGIPSQMSYLNRFRNANEDYLANLALGILAAAGGVAFTVQNAMPSGASLFLGIDVSRKYPSDESDKQINIAASAMAIYEDGTILGYSSTRPQTGEKLPGQDLVRLSRDSLVGCRRETGEEPDHVILQRDGFMHEDLDEITAFLESRDIGYDIVSVRKQSPARILRAADVQYEIPDKGIALINPSEQRAILAPFGAPEDLAMAGGTGIPQPIQVERVAGTTDIETLTRQVYLLSQSHVGVHNTTTRLPITTEFADKASTAAAKGHLVQTGGFEANLSFL